MKKAGFWSAVFLATGTMIGDGLLAVPIITGLLGFVPGVALTLLAVIMMWLAGALIAGRAPGELAILHRFSSSVEPRPA